MKRTETRHTIEAQAVASFIDQFSLQTRARLAALVFEAGASLATDTARPQDELSVDDVLEESGSERQVCASDYQASCIPILKKRQKRVLRRLRRGPAKASELADLADVCDGTIHNWCSPNHKLNVLYQLGVRINGDRQYCWPNPNIEICGTEREASRNEM